jgi:MFS family permease
MSLPALPQLQQTFRAGVSSAQLTLSIFLLGFASGQVVCGPVSDRRGRRPVLLAGLGLFALAVSPARRASRSRCWSDSASSKGWARGWCPAADPWRGCRA